MAGVSGTQGGFIHTWVRFMRAWNSGSMADGCKMIQLGLLSIMSCVRMTAVEKQDKINNEDSTTVLCYWIIFFHLLTCDGKCVAV